MATLATTAQPQPGQPTPDPPPVEQGSPWGQRHRRVAAHRRHTNPAPMPVCPDCGVLPGEEHDCDRMRRELATAPVWVITAGQVTA